MQHAENQSLTRLADAYDTHTHLFNGPLSRTARVSRHQKGKTNLDFNEARDSQWQWHQLDQSAPRSRQITMPAPHRCFLQAGCPSCRPTNSVKAHWRLHYDKIWKAILTCAQKPTYVSLIYHTEPTTKKWKEEKLKVKNGYAHKFGKRSRESMMSVLKKATVGRICRNGRF